MMNATLSQKSENGTSPVQRKIRQYFSEVIASNRPTPKWVKDEKVTLTDKQAMSNVALGTVPVGVLPSKDILIQSEEERINILKLIKERISLRADDGIRYQCGQSWSLSDSLDAYLSADFEGDELVEYSNLLVERLMQYLNNLGFNTIKFTDSLTNASYHAGLFSAVNTSSHNQSIAHVDDFLRVASDTKSDFRMPDILENQMYYQLSFCMLLDDGGKLPNPLYTYNRFYKPSDEAQCNNNGWTFPLEMMEGSKEYKHQPKIGECYAFSTTAYHDVRGNVSKAERITWRTFALYLPALNTIVIYT